MENKKSPKKRKIFHHWKLKGFTCPRHAEGYNYFNREDNEEDILELNEYCGEQQQNA